MIAAGHLALTAALISSLLHIVLNFIRPVLLVRLSRLLSASVLIFMLAAFASLLQAHITSDFSVANVAQNSHHALPLIYKITALWGNHEGSMLLFGLILGLFTWLLACFGHPHMLTSLAVVCQQAIISAFLAFILLTSNPFLRLSPIPTQGADLNPLLQDIGLILHPPLLYLGIIGFSIAFSYAVAALMKGQCDASLGRVIRPWLLFSWSLLTLGITFGSYWAYYELGWGGYWFWDPVENASLMPWLAGCALIHSARVLAKRNALKLWTLLLSILTFSLSLLGTFLVRADLLISVHNFASIPSRSLALLLIVVFFGGGALALFALRAPQLEAGASFSPLSREGALSFNNVLLTTACASVLIGTLYPMMMEVLWGERISVGAPFFNRIFSWLMVPVFLIMPFGPLIGWKRADIMTSFDRLGLGLAACLVVIISFSLLSGDRAGLASLTIAGALGLACWLIVGAMCDLCTHIGMGRCPITLVMRCCRTLPPHHYGRVLAHGGVGISLAGIIAVSAFSHEVVVSIKEGQSFPIHDKILYFERIIPYFGSNYLEDRVEFTLRQGQEQGQDAKKIGSLYAARRFYPVRNMETSEVGLFWQGMSQYYVTVSGMDKEGGVIVHAWYKAWVLAIWLGGFFMAAGGFLAFAGCLKARKKNKQKGKNL